MIGLALILLALVAIGLAFASGATRGQPIRPTASRRDDRAQADDGDQWLYEIDPYFPDRQGLDDLVAMRRAEQDGRETGGN